MADIILVNSEFTKTVFANSFRTITTVPRVLYPGIQLEQYDIGTKKPARFSDKKIILSINRFERKKNISLAVYAFALLKDFSGFENLLLVIAGNII